MKFFPSFHAALVAVILALAILLSTSGCSDDAPTSAGGKVIPKRDGLQVLTYDTDAVSSATYFVGITSNSTIEFAGAFRDIKAKLMLQFSLDITTLVPHSRIDSAYIRMPIGSRYRDTTAPLNIQVFNMRRTWSTLTVNWDSLSTAPRPYTDTVVGTYNRNVIATDTAIDVPVDTSMVHEWNTGGICSVVMIATNACGQLVGFENNFTTGVKPDLIVAYHDSVDSAGTSTNPATQMASVENCSLPPISKDFYAQGGVSYRGRLYFNVSSIPRNASIVAANLQLFLDTAATIRGDTSSGNVLAQNISNDSSSPNLGGLTGNAIIDSATRSFVTIPINNLVQDWVTRDTTNFGVSIRLDDEFISMDRLAFYGVLDPYKYRPHLHVRYTVLQ
jgi:hypothetical protein